jgi:ribosomal protein L5
VLKLLKELGMTCQKVLLLVQKKAIAGFKLREKMPVGLCSYFTWRTNVRILDRLIHLPRVRDFQN